MAGPLSLRPQVSPELLSKQFLDVELIINHKN
jgi:hypothetical protein